MKKKFPLHEVCYQCPAAEIGTQRLTKKK